MEQLKVKVNWVTFVVLLLLVLGRASFSDGLENTLSKCCTVGVRWSWENNTCSEYPTPVKGVSAEHQAPCLSTIDACCRRSYRELQCVAGQMAAKSGQECRLGSGSGAQHHKDCCEGCKLGLHAGAMGLYCEFHSLKLALGPPWDSSLTKCCLQAGGRGGLPPKTSLSTTQSPQAEISLVPSSSSSSYRPPVTRSGGERGDICSLFPGQLCSHNCISEGTSYRCTCREGFRLLPDAKSCQLDTTTSMPESSSRSRPSLGQCPQGFVYNPSSQVCDDVDECLTEIGNRACYPYKTCRNTVGSFICEDAATATGQGQQPVCPPGYQIEEATGDCVDIDECQLRVDICVREIQYCINTPGGFDCQSKKDFQRYNCPAGYKFNNATLNCDDVNECKESLDSCERGSEVCRNTAGAYECDSKCELGYRYDTRARTCQDMDECKEGTHECRIDKERCVNVPGSYQCHQLHSEDSNCPPGYEPNPNYSFLCQDRDECNTGLHTCGRDETCINEMGGYRCEGGSPASSPAAGDDSGSTEIGVTDDDNDTDDVNEISEEEDNNALNTRSVSSASTLGLRSRGTEMPIMSSPRTTERSNFIRQQPRPCPTGYRQGRSDRGGNSSCVDVNECEEQNPCDSTQICQNSEGSFYCQCRSGYYRDPITGSCQDVNECQTGQHSCLASQRCDNSPGSYSCIRITGCGTGYTLNSRSGQCEDDDECLFGNNDCSRHGPEYQCKNTLGSFTCERVKKNCPLGLSLAPNGECRSVCTTGFQFNSRGDCVDIDECTTYGRTLCATHHQCVNTMGSYQCISKIICPAGFEPDPAGNRCVDRDECADGTHTCKGNQECLNRGGGFICQCPPGHTLRSGNCEDINECERQVCASNAECHNTIGSFHCICKEGFEHGSDNRTCSDINECETIAGLCEQTCINTWGSYKCACGVGFTLGEEGRSCRDVDECAEAEGNYLCIGNCVNTHGSYRCDCPDGYKLGSDSRTCQDIDECALTQACRQDEQCLNTRGGFRCNRIDCPPSYSRDGDLNDRCKKSVPCKDRDHQCLREPLTISKNYISFTSKIRIPSTGYVDMFTMRGPSWSGAVMHFHLEVKSTRSPNGVPAAGRNHFLLRRPTPYQAVVALAKPIEGPQDIELELKMEVFHRGSFAGSAVAQILIVVTTYEF
ncbi:fibulin-1 [Folsomia candida]|uniref:fibulin-1 n=1 Tax=Folsomia candida TaxID=158441 RepID=UPI000B90835C|nr:fibulin-1 [Folsomia candida]